MNCPRRCCCGGTRRSCGAPRSAGLAGASSSPEPEESCGTRRSAGAGGSRRSVRSEIVCRRRQTDPERAQRSARAERSAVCAPRDQRGRSASGGIQRLAGDIEQLGGLGEQPGRVQGFAASKGQMRIGRTPERSAVTRSVLASSKTSSYGVGRRAAAAAAAQSGSVRPRAPTAAPVPAARTDGAPRVDHPGASAAISSR